MKDHEHQSLLLSKLVLNVPYDASVVDPVFASYVRENALTCIVTGKWQQAAPLALQSHGAESGGRNPFARALKSHGEGSEGSVAYYCSRSTRSFGLTAARLKSGENAKIGRKRLPGEQPDGNYTETKRLHILRVTWQEGFVLDLREIGVNPYSRQVSFTLKNSAPLSGGCFPQEQLKKAVHDVVAAERLARNELGNPQHPWEQYVAGQKKLEPSQKLLETRGGSGGGDSVEQGNGNRGKGAGVAFQLDEPFDEQNPLEPHQMRGMSFPERETLSLDFYIFKPSEKQTVLGATGVSGEVIYHFNQIVDIEKWAASTKRRIVDEIPGVSVPSSGTASGERCIHRTVRVAEAQAARWQGRKHLQPFCELEFESVDATYGSVVESPRKKRARKISALADVSAGGGGAGDPDPTSEGAPAKKKREELVERSKKAGSAADTARLQQSARSSQNGTHKCYNLAWTLGRPKGLGFHFANSKAFQKMKFWDLVRMKTIQKTALLGQKRKTRRRDGAPEVKPRNKSVSRAGKRKRRSKSAELPDEGSIPASPRRMRELRDAAFVNQLKYEHVYSNNDVFQSAEDVKKYYYRAGYNNHLLNPTWFSAFQKSDWREREFYVRTAAVEDLDVLSDESEADSVFDRDSALDELEHEGRELDTLSEEDEQLPPPYVSRLERAKNSARDYLKPFFWWAVYRALDMEAARIAVKSCVETVRDVVVEEENSSIATAVLDDLARSITRKVVELEHGTLADRVIQHSVDNAAATEDVQTAMAVDSLLDSVYGNSLRRMKNEHIVIARRTLNRVYTTVVEQWKALVLTEQEKQGRGSSDEGGSEADAVLHASTWGQNRGDADSIYSVDTADHHSIAVCELGYRGPYAIGCEGIRVIEHFTDFHASGEAGGDGKEHQTKNGKDEFDAAYDVQRERKQARRERRQQIAEETEMRKQVMSDARKFRRELRKRLEFLGDAHGLLQELRGFEHDIFNSEFGVANPQNERRGPSVKELVVAEARARRSGMVNYPADDEAEHRKFAPRERSATAERDRSRSAVPVPRAAEEGKAKGGDQAKTKPRSVRIATTLPEDTGKNAGKAEQQQHQQYAGFVQHVYNHNVLQEEQQSARRRNKLAASQLNPAHQMDKVSAFDLEQRKHKLLRTRAAPGAAAAVLDEMGKSEAELVSGGAVRVRIKEETRSRGRTRRSSTGAEMITAAEMITGGSSSSGTKPAGGIQRENPVARDENEFFVLRACSSRLRKTAVECGAVVGESGAAQLRRKTGRVSERKSADGYYKDRETYTWEQPPPPPDVFTRERDQVLASYTNTVRKDKTSRAGLRKSTLDELELLHY